MASISKQYPAIFILGKIMINIMGSYFIHFPRIQSESPNTQMNQPVYYTAYNNKKKKILNSSSYAYDLY